MLELASRTIGAVKFFMESFAELSLIVLRDVLLGVQFMSPVSERTTLFKSTKATQLPILAYLSFIFCPEAFNVPRLLFLSREGLFRFLDS